MSTDIRACTDTPALRAASVTQRNGATQVGRDRHFLAAVLAPGERIAQAADAAAFDAAHRGTAPHHPGVNDTAGSATGSAAHAAASRTASPPPPAHSSVAVSASASVQAANPARGSANSVQVRTHTAVIPHSPPADITAGKHQPPPRGGEKPWLPQNITLRETADGVEVFTRNYFLDDAGRRQLAHRLLQDLRLAGKSPRQLTLNGELVWRADDTAPQDGAPHELASGTR